ncbi:hypothetical protein L1887_11387 [Cichorium endivia]|nr:hypothetical protein L1887_11387 [Cichorium endivia]
MAAADRDMEERTRRKKTENTTGQTPANPLQCTLGFLCSGALCTTGDHATGNPKSFDLISSDFFHGLDGLQVLALDNNPLNESPLRFWPDLCRNFS